MSSDSTATVTAIGNSGLHDAVGASLEWCLTVFHHPESRFMGRRVVLEAGRTVQIGREESHFGEGGLAEKRVSRKHARIWVTEGGRLKLEDLGSRNGTRVNGADCERIELKEGDLVGIGGLLLLAHRAPGIFPSPAHPRLIGIGHGMGEVLKQIRQVGPHSTHVLIRGETGTGKELAARAIHDASNRKGGFFSVNCGGMPDTLLQSELFGHARGAFSGADRDRVGLIEAAHQGTLFLDEIGDASPALQVSLLRFLQEGEIRRLGSNRTVQVNTRIIAATHRALTAEEGSSFREDLYARLSRWEILLPPLRDRREDIPILIQHFIKKHAPGKTLHPTLSEQIGLYSWPRNVRELEMIVERLVIESEEENVLRLTPAIRAHFQTDEGGKETPPPLGIREKSREGLLASLSTHKGNVRAVSKDFGVARNTLYRWFKEYELEPEEFRE